MPDGVLSERTRV